MRKKIISDLDLKGKRVLIRVDFNVPLKEGVIKDDTRITAAIPTIKYALDNGAKTVVLMSHLGRPKGGGKVEPEFSLKPVADYLANLLNIPVQFAPDCIGDATEKLVNELPSGSVVLLENLRFYSEEEGKVKVAEGTPDEEKQALKAAMKEKQKTFAANLAKLGDVYVNDAFGTAHRAHASMAVVTKHFSDCAAGFLLEKEIEYLGNAVTDPKRPFVAILGGAKVSDKIPVIENLLNKADAIIIGGAMAYTFLKAQEIPTGKSLVEADFIEIAKGFIAKAKEKNIPLLLPIDHVVSTAFDADDQAKIVTEIADDEMGLDIGPKTIELFSKEILKAKTVVWNGPMGVFEKSCYAKGTFDVAKAVADSDSISIIGGGDSVSAINKSGLADKVSHISTGGGASLEYLEGKELPGIKALSDK